MAGGINIDKTGISKAEGLYNIYSIKTPASESLDLKENLFKVTLDKAVESLNRISAQEMKAETLVEDYVQGKVGLEEVMIEMEKANVSISLALTVINSAVQTTKEILQMAV